MSRIGKLPIHIPENVTVNYIDSQLTIQGKFGILQTMIPETIGVQQDESILRVSLKSDTRNLRALHGLYRTLINNMIVGVSEQFQLTLILKGVGYRAAVQGKEIVLNLGYSHPVKIEYSRSPISVEVVQNTTINLKSCDKELLGLFAQLFELGGNRNPIKEKGFYIKMSKLFVKQENLQNNLIY
jgi:large subunit ribosomal protein L6